MSCWDQIYRELKAEAFARLRDRDIPEELELMEKIKQAADWPKTARLMNELYNLRHNTR